MYTGAHAPSGSAVSILNDLFDKNAVSRLMILACSGHHVHNPYHNLDHELQHLYFANACAVNSCIIDERELRHLAVASLFHDHNHSGGKQSDAENISNALFFVEQVCRSINRLNKAEQLLDAQRILPLIEVTQFNGRAGFNREPQNPLEKAMRDADLMSIYTEEGRTILLGLASEFGAPWSSLKTSEKQDSLDRNAEFLRTADMYTKYGQRMKTLYLENSLKDFAALVKSL